jgi:hypothetical protein
MFCFNIFNIGLFSDKAFLKVFSFLKKLDKGPKNEFASVQKLSKPSNFKRTCLKKVIRHSKGTKIHSWKMIPSIILYFHWCKIR